MDDIDRMAEQFSTVAEMKKYSNAQYMTIVSLSKKINELQDENQDLKKQLLNSTPKEITEENQIIESLKMGADYEVIAKIQLNRYKEVAMERELSLEETKKVEILTKVLFAGQVKAKDPAKPNEHPDVMTNEELMKLLGNV